MAGFEMVYASDPSGRLPAGRVWTPRRVVKLALIIPAFLLVSINWYETAGLCLLILALMLFVFPQVGINLGKVPTGELSRSLLSGINLYPLSLLALTLIFRHHLAVVAGTWALFALGDVAAGAVGERWTGASLPFNRQKNRAELIAFAVFGTAGCFVLLAWTDPSRTMASSFAISMAAGVAGSLVASLPIRLDGHLTVPLACGGLIFCLSLMSRASLASNLPYLGIRIVLALAVNLVLALLVWGLRQVSFSGAAVGFFLGVGVYIGFGYKSFLVLLAFFVLASAATRLGYTQKKERGIAERRGGARGWREALANILPPALFSVLVITTPYQSAFLLALTAAFAEAAGDTVSSETGKWASSTARRITDWKLVPAGEEGAVSLAGTVAGFSASVLVAVLAWGLGLGYGWGIAAALGAAIVGNLLDSVLGATLERRGLVTNGIVNFAGTSVAGALALAFALHR